MNRTLSIGLVMSVAALLVGACRDDSPVSEVGTSTGGSAEDSGSAEFGSGSGTSGGYVPSQCEQNETVIGLMQQSVVGLTPAELIAEVSVRVTAIEVAGSRAWVG